MSTSLTLEKSWPNAGQSDGANSIAFLLAKIGSLPSKMQKEVSLFVDFLISKKPRKVVPKAGSLKGKIHMAPDFDDPLPDMKEYME